MGMAVSVVVSGYASHELIYSMSSLMKLQN